MNAAEIVIGKVQGDGSPQVLHFLEKALVSLVSLRICIRIVRFWRSICDVQIRS